MPLPFIGEIKLFGGNFAPSGWFFCDGTLLPIQLYEVLFNLIGTTYGGDGQATFALPDLRGRAPLHQGTGAGVFYPIGEYGGVETVTLTHQQIPAHTHGLTAVQGQPGNLASPAGMVPAMSLNVVPFVNDVPTGDFAPQAVTPTGANQPHQNMQPYLGVSFIIAVEGVYPSQA